MRNLHQTEITNIIKSYPDCRNTAVNNFLVTVTANKTITDAKLNLIIDSIQYDWNESTYKAIYEGICLSDRPEIMVMEKRLIETASGEPIQTRSKEV